ncbi:uncharacterized protein LOC132631087 [Lycium barbarum]|uniref:uncharacterized protein LOC132631087 n=1 Tax=Lycium barbarum TaxID=112863 RepID=UPI00293F2DBB|nr:uncharacterized protein LOC132631087 [Lycium barbarum]
MVRHGAIGWFDAFKVRPWCTDLLREFLDKVKLIQKKLLAAQSRQKEYEDRKVRDLEFMVGEQVLLKVSPMNGLSGVHLVFHVSMLKKYHSDGSYIIQLRRLLGRPRPICERDTPSFSPIQVPLQHLVRDLPEAFSTSFQGEPCS